LLSPDHQVTHSLLQNCKINQLKGPGGQNVNKLNTKAEVRFKIGEADWIPFDVRQRLRIYQANKISNDDEIIVTSQEHRFLIYLYVIALFTTYRTQSGNKKDCIEKLQEMIAEAYIEPKEREMWEGLSEKGKEIRKQEKRKRGAVKDSRREKNRRSYDD
jgi:peptidyl-tRNA hydrolase ICT1